MTPTKVRVFAQLGSHTEGTATSEFVVLLVCLAVGGIVAWRFFGVVVVRILSG